MPTDFWFRFSTYLSLALACVCLGYAEWRLLPEVTAFTAVVVLLLGVSFFLDRRFELSLAKANALGLGIGVAAVVWLAWQLTSPRKDSPLADIEWPTNMLPLIGPVLMTLVPAKLFRPKHVGDWWAMHGVAVAAVALASSMTDDAAFVALLAAYAVCSAWALVLFFYRRSGGFIAPIPNRPAPPQAQLAPADPDARPPKWVFARTLAWLTAGTAVALVLYVALPRSEGYVWVFSRKYYVTGDTGDSKLVMNKAGELTESDAVAFRFVVTDADGNPKADFDPDVYWRGQEFVSYVVDDSKRESSWGTQSTDLTYLSIGGQGAATAADFGPGGYAVQVTLSTPKQTPVAVSPVRWVANRSPVLTDGGRTPFIRGNGVAFMWPGKLEGYTQACGPGDPPDTGTPFELISPIGISPLKRNGPEYFREYARGLLARLIADGKVPADAKLDDLEQVPEGRHEVVARAFTAHFRESGEFTYTTTLEPQDRKIDPLVDFVKNTKTGHCEWFAGALVLTLRAVGIPAQYVSGYRGWDVDDTGAMVVRQRQAHAWAEVLVSRPAPADFPFRTQTPPHLRDRVWYWLTLDPTTGGSATAPPAKNWLEQGASWFTDFFLRFDKAKRERAVEEVAQAAADGWPWAAGGLAAAVAGWLGWRWWRRREANRPQFDGPDWYARCQAVLAARGFTRAAGQTPREFADATAAALPAVAAGVEFLTAMLYRVRYAGSPLTPDEVRQVNAALDRLEQTLSPR